VEFVFEAVSQLVWVLLSEVIWPRLEPVYRAVQRRIGLRVVLGLWALAILVVWVDDAVPVPSTEFTNILWLVSFVGTPVVALMATFAFRDERRRRKSLRVRGFVRG
jgi:hypothetical protein